MLALGLAAIWLVAGCRPTEAPSAAGDRPNVLLIITDTTRADRLGCYGSSAGLTPHLDALAARGVRFDSVRAHAPWTLPSIASLFTSLHPAAHGAGGRLGRFTALARDSVTTLAEAFGANGYATGAVVNVVFLGPQFGLDRGFDHLDFYAQTTNEHMRIAEKTTAAALAWMKSVRQRPFFAVVHYFDPHLIYDPPEPYRSRHADPRDVAASDKPFGMIGDMIALRRGELKLTESRIRSLEKLYNGEVAYVDSQIGRLLDGIDRLGLKENTIVVVTADHGEEFFDHGGFEHGHTLYEEIVRVPLIFAGGEIPAGMVVGTGVGLVDVAPTLCELADLPIPETFHGQSLLPAMEGGVLPERPLLSQGNMWGPPLNALVVDNHKFIKMPYGTRLFDLAADPLEKNNLGVSQPERLKAMAEDLELMLKTVETTAVAVEALDLSPEERQRLCGLGYLDCGD